MQGHLSVRSHFGVQVEAPLALERCFPRAQLNTIANKSPWTRAYGERSIRQIDAHLKAALEARRGEVAEGGGRVCKAQDADILVRCQGLSRRVLVQTPRYEHLAATVRRNGMHGNRAIHRLRPGACKHGFPQGLYDMCSK